MDFEQEYQDACGRNTDMHEHLPWISEIVADCKHTTELGVGHAQSTRGFLRHDNEHHSYEYLPYDSTIEYFKNAKNAGRNVTLHISDTRTIKIAETDVMLVDSYHSYEQVKTELELHADNVKKYIFFHDTSTFGDRGQGGEVGVWPAIQEFLDTNPKWVLIERRTNNNGMTLIKRIG